MNSMLSVNDSVWVAAAVMSYEKYHKDGLRNISDFTLLSTDIRERGTQINGATIEAARTSQWCCGDHEHHNYPYLKQIDSNNRRLAYPDEFGGGEIPEDINTGAIIDTSMGNVTVQQLIDFVKNDYKAIFSKEDEPFHLKEMVDGVFYPTLDEFEPGISAEEYERVLCDESYVKKPWLDVLIYLYRMGGIGSCKQIANKFGKSAPHYNSNAINIAKAVAKATGCPLDTRETGETRYWPVLFFGKDLPANSPDGMFLYKMREPLKEAIKVIEERGEFQEMKDRVEFDKNLILYGPPGTGKTYNSAIYAVAICDDRPLKDVEALDYDVVMARYNELKAAGRIAFTTFHQSYGYEEFIEGIKPVMNDNQTSGDVKYAIEDGVFKKFCKNAAITFDDAWSKLVEAAKSNGNKYTFTRRTGSKINAQLLNDELFSVQFEGETAAHNNMPKSRIKQIYEQHVYEDRLDIPNGGTRWVFDACYAVLDTLVKEYCLPEDPNAALENRVFIIDEINRGNISKIFGELITLIEGSKRSGMPEAASATLPYSGEEFSVPSNVYILGTMNTADRSIALMDTALRRRFQFIEKMPDPEVLKNITIDGLDISKMLESINKRIEFLYDREHTIGHAFFMPLKNNPSVECLGSIFEKSVIPLLQEYFYEDYQKIQLVLGDNGKKDEEADIKFIKDTKAVAKDIFVGNVEDVIDLPEKSYSINTGAFLKIESYKRIAPGL